MAAAGKEAISELSGYKKLRNNRIVCIPSSGLVLDLGMMAPSPSAPLPGKKAISELSGD